MHVVHFPFKLRVGILASALTIVFSGDITQTLLLALSVGELLGYLLEIVIRSNFRERADQVSSTAPHTADPVVCGSMWLYL